jgi:4-hydroxy-tetrahydrodipicolinate synthase
MPRRNDRSRFISIFPAQSGLAWHIALVRRLLDRWADRIVGLKDSSGDLAYARQVAAVRANFSVFPSSEAVLMEARSGVFAGCVSATANLNADLCAQAWRTGSDAALATAISIRKLFDGKQLVPGVKALLAHVHGEESWARVKPPLSSYTGAEQAALATLYDGLRARNARPSEAVPENA